jgi:hypothetical protein
MNPNITLLLGGAICFGIHVVGLVLLVPAYHEDYNRCGPVEICQDAVNQYVGGWFVLFGVMISGGIFMMVLAFREDLSNSRIAARLIDKEDSA